MALKNRFPTFTVRHQTHSRSFLRGGACATWPVRPLRMTEFYSVSVR